MAEKPIPSTEAVSDLAAAWHEHMREHYPPNEVPPPYDELDAGTRYRLRAQLLPYLVAAYPQIVADVLNHYADYAESPDAAPYMARHRVGMWLRAQAAEVLS